MKTFQSRHHVVKRIQRVEEGHELIGEYVVEVTRGMTKARANRWCGRSNAMVRARGQERNRFRVERDGTFYFVIRKLLIGDPVDFIMQGMIGGK